ncbi:MAG: FliI/YscN family ATPase [Planctomycetota bacterium]|nr:FliI/YscN family ATPase [Planctomycetota bacterium]
MTVLASAIQTVRRVQPMRIVGRVAELRGLTLLAEDLPMPVGTLVRIRGLEGDVFGEIVGLSRRHAIVMLLGQTTGIRAGDEVVGEQVAQTVGVSHRMLGRVLDGLGRPIDDLGPIADLTPRALNPEPLTPLRRAPIREVLTTGVRALDLMTTLGRGQRLGIFAGPGVGKSTLMGTIAQRTSADVNVIALIGERGREVKDFIHHALGPEGLKRSVVIVATGDESPLMRIRAAKAAATIAEFFRDPVGGSRDVLLMMDSVTRFAHAQRQIGLSVGEPPATKGYTPSVFAQMALLLERAGSVVPPPGHAKGGSVTGLYTILVEGDDMTEPVSDAARGILDGHVILSRKLAQKAHYPAIDVLDSISRVADEICEPSHSAARRTLMRALALYREVEDLVQIGAYVRGNNPESDAAIDFNAQINALLRQGRGEQEPFDKARAMLQKLAQALAEASARNAKARGRA